MGKRGESTGGGNERQGRVRAVADIVPAAGRAAFRRFGFVESSIVARWGEIVGDTYAKHSAPESLRFPHGQRAGGTLTVVIEGAFAPTMTHVAPQIVERVNRFFGYAAIERLSLRHGEPAAVRNRPPPRPEPVAAEALSSEVTSSLKAVADPGLRASLEALARQLGAVPGLPTVR